MLADDKQDFAIGDLRKKVESLERRLSVVEGGYQRWGWHVFVKELPEPLYWWTFFMTVAALVTTCVLVSLTHGK